MTGFGSSATVFDEGRCHVEVRSVNNRYLKVHFRIPDEYCSLEKDLEQIVCSYITRGSVYVTIRITEDTSNKISINKDLLKEYLCFAGELGISENMTLESFSQILGLPGVISQDYDLARLENAKKILNTQLKKALGGLVKMRSQEGKRLKEDLHRHIKCIENDLEKVKARSHICIGEYRKRLEERIDNAYSNKDINFSEEDLLREIVFVAEKSDIAEEVDRLYGHISHFLSKLGQDISVEPLRGKSLEFIAQEMLRESNTMGSKSIDSQISRKVVDIKSRIDRIKEQVQNVE